MFDGRLGPCSLGLDPQPTVHENDWTDWSLHEPFVRHGVV